MGRMHAFAVTLGAGCVISAAALAGDIRVPGDVPTIQGAIDIAADGDRVLVDPGVYGPIDFLGKAITVEATGGAADTVIDGGGQELFVVRFSSGEGRGSVLRGFTVTGGFGALRDNRDTGGGVIIHGAAPIIDSCVIAENGGVNAGGILSRRGDPLLTGLRVEGNDSSFGGGVGVLYGSAEIVDSTFIGNSGAYGGGLSIQAASVELRDLVFEENVASSFGGAIYTNHATLSASGLTCTANGEFEERPDGSIRFGTFGGGAVYTKDTNGRIEASRFDDNGAFAGGGVYVAGSGTLELVNCLVVSNVTALGGLYANASNPVVINSTIADNRTFGIFTTYNAFPTVENSIFTGQTNVASTEIAGNGVTTVRYSLIDGDAFSVEFLDGVVFEPARLDRGYQPLPGSGAIDAGDNNAVPEGVVTDLLGNDRFFDDSDTQDSGLGEAPIVDLGAIEFGSGPGGCMHDFDGNGVVDTRDVTAFLAAWRMAESEADVNEDGRVDTLDAVVFLNAWSGGDC